MRLTAAAAPINPSALSPHFPFLAFSPAIPGESAPPHFPRPFLKPVPLCSVAMNEQATPEQRRASRAVRRLFDAIDRALAAAREVEAARAALAKTASSPRRLRVVSDP